MRSRHRLGLRAAITVERRPDGSEDERGRCSFSANHTTSFFFVSGFGSRAYSAKLLAGTRHRFSGLSQPRQCGDDVLRMLVTGGPPVRGGGGISPPQGHGRSNATLKLEGDFSRFASS
jgi:hypothetical protein